MACKGLRSNTPITNGAQRKPPHSRSSSGIHFPSHSRLGTALSIALGRLIGAKGSFNSGRRGGSRPVRRFSQHSSSPLPPASKPPSPGSLPILPHLRPVNDGGPGAGGCDFSGGSRLPSQTESIPPMRRAAAILCLLLSITCGVLWVRSYKVHEIFALRVFWTNTLAIGSGYRRQMLCFTHNFDQLFSGKIPPFSFRKTYSDPITSEDWAYADRHGRSWLLRREGRSVVLVLPAWFTTGTPFLAALLLAFGPCIRILFHRKPTPPPTSSPGR